MAFNISNLIIDKPKPIPILLLLDCSASMNVDGRINNLNDAVDEMLAIFQREEKHTGRPFLVTLITFRGTKAEVLQPPAPVSEIRFTPLKAFSTTPLGSALDKAFEIIEDRSLTPSRACRPIVILLCDGLPTDNWEPALLRFINGKRTSKCDRMALAVGEKLPAKAMEMLCAFLSGTGNQVIQASKAEGIVTFFKYVTMTVTLRTQSKSPDVLPTAVEIERAVKSLEEIQEEEFRKLVEEVEPLGFTQSAEVSAYIRNNHLGHRFPHISGTGTFLLGSNEWRFDGAISRRYYAKLCSVLHLSDQGSGAVMTNFSPFSQNK